MTPAGRRLLDRLEQALVGDFEVRYPDEASVAAIEAEAVAAERALALPVIEAARAVSAQMEHSRTGSLAEYELDALWTALAAWEEGK